MRRIFAFGRAFCGSRLLARLFATCRDVLAEHETPGLYGPGEDVYLCRRDPRPVLRVVLGPLMCADPPLITVEVNPALWAYAHALRQTWGRCKLVYVHRDPRRHVATIRRSGQYDPAAGFEANMWCLKALPADHPAAAGWATLPPLLQAAWDWRTVNQTCLAAQPDERIAFEALTADGEAFCDLARRLGLEPDRRRADALVARRLDKIETRVALPPWAEWTPQDQAAVAEIVRPVAAEVGYVLP